MGRHTTPGTGAPEPDRGFWARIAVAAILALLVGGYAVSRLGGGDDTVGTAANSTSSTPAPSRSRTPATSTPATSTPPTRSATSVPAATTTPAPAPTGRPPTLSFTVRYPAYITVRVPGGVTLVSKLFKAGSKASYDRKALQVVNGRPDAVRFVVNGKPRKPGPSGQTEVFTVRRK